MEAAALPRAPRRRLAAGQVRVLRLAGDARLARAVGAGSDAAFEVLYERHHRPLLAFCRHMLGNREEAEDALQSTFMTAYHALRLGSEPPVELRAWLYTIARHRCLRTLNARTPYDLDEAVPVATEGLGDQVQRRAELRAILGDLAQLPEDQRAALLLAQLHGMSHEEIGVVLEVPTKKVKALVFQARESLVANREARAIPCAEIRAQLAELSGGALRRRPLQRHLRACEGCREFRAQLRRQRSLLAAALPVVPSAGLRDAVLGATTGGTASAGGAGGLFASAAALKGAALNLAVGAGATAALAGGIAAGGGALHQSRPAGPPPTAVLAPDAGRAVAAQARAATAHKVPSAAKRLHVAPTPTLAPHLGRDHPMGTAGPRAESQSGSNASDGAGTSSDATSSSRSSSGSTSASDSQAAQDQGGASGTGSSSSSSSNSSNSNSTNGGNAGRSTARHGNGTANGTDNPKSSGSQGRGTPASGRSTADSGQGTPAGQGTTDSGEAGTSASGQGAGAGTPASGEGGGSKGRGAVGQGADTQSAGISQGVANGGGPDSPPGQAKK